MIQDFADWLVYGIFGLSAGTSLGTAVNFFFYDTVKILILLFFISVLMGIVNAYFPIERLRNYLVTHRMYGLQYLLAALFGAITPFCSCSSIPRRYPGTHATRNNQYLPDFVIIYYSYDPRSCSYH